MKPILILAIVLVSCGPAAKLRRAEKLIEKAEEKGAKWHVDTMFVQVPIVVPSVRVEEKIITKPGDTVVLEKERLKVVIRRLQGDTVFIQAECEADTIVKEVPITVVKTITAKGGIKWWWILVALAAGTFLGRFVIKAFLG